MSISLSKGQKISLSKEAAGISRLTIGLGWDPIKQGGKGLLGGIFGGNAPQIDCDASVIMLNEQGKFERKEDVVYFGHLKSSCGSIQHCGDNLTGEGDGDDEQIIVDLAQVPDRISRLVFVVNIYDCVNRNQNFGMVQNAYIRAVDTGKGQEVLRYNLTEGYQDKTAMIFGEIYKHNGEWKFSAVGDGTNDKSLTDLVRRYQ